MDPAPRPAAPPTLSLHRVGYGHPDALALIEEVQRVYVERYGSEDETPLDPLMFEPPTGSFFVGYVGGDPVATGAWRRHDVPALGLGATAEVKRMYVVPRAQRCGHARRMLAVLEADAAACGAAAMILETGTRQPEAIALYESAGYRPVAGFGHYAGDSLSRSFAKPLVVDCSTSQTGGPGGA